MEWLPEIVVILVGFALRLGVPIGLTVLLILFLRRLDERWQAEITREKAPPIKAKPRNIGCWEMNSCPAEQRATCNAFANPEMPCWQVFRDGGGILQEKCLACQVFRKTPVAIPVT